MVDFHRFSIGGWVFIEHLRRVGIGEHYLVEKGRDHSQRFLGRILPAIPPLPDGSLTTALRQFKQRGQLEHRHIIKLHAIGESLRPGEEGHSVWFISEYFDADRVLSSYLSHSKLTTEEAITGVIGALDALRYIDERNLHHGYLSPDSLIMNEDGLFSITDPTLGTVHDIYHRIFTSGTSNFDFTYDAPEAYTKETPTDIISDVFSLGAVLYFLLTGHKPFRATTVFALDPSLGGAQPIDPRDYIADMNPSLCAVLATALQVDRNERYPDPTIFLADLVAVRKGQEPPFASPRYRGTEDWISGTVDNEDTPPLPEREIPQSTSMRPQYAPGETAPIEWDENGPFIDEVDFTPRGGNKIIKHRTRRENVAVEYTPRGGHRILIAEDEEDEEEAEYTPSGGNRIIGKRGSERQKRGRSGHRRQAGSAVVRERSGSSRRPLNEIFPDGEYERRRRRSKRMPAMLRVGLALLVGSALALLLILIYKAQATVGLRSTRPAPTSPAPRAQQPVTRHSEESHSTHSSYTPTNPKVSTPPNPSLPSWMQAGESPIETPRPEPATESGTSEPAAPEPGAPQPGETGQHQSDAVSLAQLPSAPTPVPLDLTTFSRAGSLPASVTLDAITFHVAEKNIAEQPELVALIGPTSLPLTNHRHELRATIALPQDLSRDPADVILGFVNAQQQCESVAVITKGNLALSQLRAGAQVQSIKGLLSNQSRRNENVLAIAIDENSLEVSWNGVLIERLPNRFGAQLVTPTIAIARYAQGATDVVVKQVSLASTAAFSSHGAPEERNTPAVTWLTLVSADTGSGLVRVDRPTLTLTDTAAWTPGLNLLISGNQHTSGYHVTLKEPGAAPWKRIEKNRPFYMYGANSGTLNIWKPAPGDHQFTVQPIDEHEQAVGEARIFTITVR